MSGKVRIKLKTSAFEKNVETGDNEHDIWKAIGETLLEVDVPGTLIADCEYGTAILNIGRRGSYTKNGIKKPSMFVTVNNNMYGMPPGKPYKEAYLTCINHESNNYKYYYLKPLPDGRIDVEYGRIGATAGEMFAPKKLQDPYDSYLFWIRYYEKLSKGYVDQSDVFLGDEVYEAEAVTSVKSGKPLSVGAKLYNKLLQLAHNYVEETLLSKKVTKKQVEESRKLLELLSCQLTVEGFNNVLRKLMSISPRKARYVSDFMANSKSDFKSVYEREESLILAMEAVVSGSVPVAESKEKTFNGIEVELASESQKKFVLDRLNPGLKTKVKEVYAINPVEQDKRFASYIKKNKIHEVKMLWHGSRNQNWASIVQNGLLLNPNAIITGKMFGNGIYFAPTSLKSWGYTSYYGTRWANGRERTAFMGLYETAYGTPKDVEAPESWTQQKLNRIGCNCIHAHSGRYLMNDEIVYYNEDAMVLRYLVEFEE